VAAAGVERGRSGSGGGAPRQPVAARKATVLQ